MSAFRFGTRVVEETWSGAIPVDTVEMIAFVAVMVVWLLMLSAWAARKAYPMLVSGRRGVISASFPTVTPR
jgi:hypothetical protein